MMTCAEDVDYGQYGIKHNRCIDGELLERLFPEDKGLMYYLHTGKFAEPDMFGEYPSLPLKPKNLKDKGQLDVDIGAQTVLLVGGIVGLGRVLDIEEALLVGIVEHRAVFGQ